LYFFQQDQELGSVLLIFRKERKSLYLKNRFSHFLSIKKVLTTTTAAAATAAAPV
jgi:hypothetical protein